MRAYIADDDRITLMRYFKAFEVDTSLTLDVDHRNLLYPRMITSNILSRIMKEAYENDKRYICFFRNCDIQHDFIQERLFRFASAIVFLKRSYSLAVIDFFQYKKFAGFPLDGMMFIRGYKYLQGRLTQVEHTDYQVAVLDQDSFRRKERNLKAIYFNK